MPATDCRFTRSREDFVRAWAMCAMLSGVLALTFGSGCDSAGGIEAIRGAACERLFDAQATQAQRCLGVVFPGKARAHMRDRFRDQCTQLFHLPGSGASLASMDACTNATTTVSCHDTRVPTACQGAPGSLESEAPCNVSTQCKSLNCQFATDVTSPTCGSCQPVRATGDVCGRDGSVCAAGSDCVNAHCTANGAQPAGAPCNLSETCALGQSCYDRACRPLGANGDTCRTGIDCGDGLVCVAETCRAAIAAAGDCSPMPRACADGLVCDPATGTCTPPTLAEPGGACGLPIHTACALGACDATSASATGHCPIVLADGDACSGANSGGVCDTFSICVAGVCRRTNASVCQ